MPNETITNSEVIEHSTTFDFENYPAAAHAIAALALKVSRLTEEFTKVERIPRYSGGQHENDVEHSYMLALAAPEIARMLELEMNMEKVMGFALCHDLIEIKTGDVPTFTISPAELEAKEQREQMAKQELLDELPSGIAQYLEAYEQQDTKEAIFVRIVDKLLPVAVDITGNGLQVMREDYNVTTYEQARSTHAALHERVTKKFGEHFPELIGAHAVLCAILAEQFSTAPAP